MKQLLAKTILMALAWVVPATAQEVPPAPSQVTWATVSAIAKEHLKKPNIGKQFCRRWLKKYLETLDPSKLYFLESDISEFEKHAADLHETVANGDTELFKLVSNRYQLRTESALKHTLDRIDLSFDFTTDESVPSQYMDWPESNIDRIERWRLRLKFDLLVERSRTDGHGNPIEFLKTRYTSIRKQANELTVQQALGVCLDSFCKTADPHSAYVTPDEFRSFFGGMLKEYSIGLLTTVKDGRTIIRGIGVGFSAEPLASEILGCELLAICWQNGVTHNFREILPSTTRRLIRDAKTHDNSVTLELYDEVRNHRFAVNWPRK